MLMMSIAGDSDTKLNECGLAQSHAYTVLGAKMLSNGARIVKIRNPWGKEKYKCDWSDESTLWTKELRAEVGAPERPQDDGIFFMSIEDYFAQVEATYLNYDTESMHHSYFLMLNDNGMKGSEAGIYSWCGSECNRHKMKIVSPVDQVVYVTAHTWDQRSEPKECTTDYRKTT